MSRKLKHLMEVRINYHPGLRINIEAVFSQTLPFYTRLNQPNDKNSSAVYALTNAPPFIVIL